MSQRTRTLLAAVLKTVPPPNFTHLRNNPSTNLVPANCSKQAPKKNPFKIAWREAHDAHHKLRSHPHPSLERQGSFHPPINLRQGKRMAKPRPTISIHQHHHLDQHRLRRQQARSPANLRHGRKRDNEQISSLAQSYWLSRDLVNTEILDWSACNHTVDCGGANGIPGQCMVFVQRTSPDSNHNALRARTCYVLTPEATVSQLPRDEWVVEYVLS